MGQEIGGVQEYSLTLMDGASVAAGGSQSSTEVGMAEDRGVAGIVYKIESVLGSPQVDLEISIGTDTTGADIWVVWKTSTNAKDAFSLDIPCGKFRVTVTETGGTSGLSDISVHTKVRTL